MAGIHWADERQELIVIEVHPVVKRMECFDGALQSLAGEINEILHYLPVGQPHWKQQDFCTYVGHKRRLKSLEGLPTASQTYKLLAFLLHSFDTADLPADHCPDID